MAVVLAWHRAGFVSEVEFLPGVFFWVTTWLTMWLLAYSFTLAGLTLFPDFYLKRRIVQFLAAIIASFVMRILMPTLVFITYKISSVEAAAVYENFGYFPKNILQFTLLAYHAAIVVALWLIANYFFEILGIELYPVPNQVAGSGLSTAENEKNLHVDLLNQADDVKKRPLFMRDIPDTEIDDVIAVSAADHYIRVVTENREMLVHYRFKDCLHELNHQPGIQIHRSHWVRSSSIQELIKKGRKTSVKLVNGLVLPVSQSYIVIVNEKEKTGEISYRTDV